MLIDGWCTQCRKVRRVRVTGLGLALASGRGNLVQGVCNSCEEENETKRKEASGRPAGRGYRN